ncbi:MAG: hypothetical protein ACRD17_09300 [Terriglobales bacterium]
MSTGARGPLEPLTADKLLSERRGFIAGSIIVLVVVWLTTLILMAPALKKAAAAAQQKGHPSFTQMESKLAKHEPGTAEIIFFAGALGLLVLNARFSRMIRRPRAAYRVPPDATAAGARLAWLAALVINSLLYNAIVPEIIILVLLSHWANSEIHYLREHPPGRDGSAALEPWGREHRRDDR